MKLATGTFVGALLAGMSLALMPLGASAVVLQTMTFTGGNDCPGVFGPSPTDPTKPGGQPLYTGFSACWVQDAGNYYSPSIVKFDWPIESDSSGNYIPDEVSTRYPSVDGSEFDFLNTGAGGVSGTWTYDPGPDDPAIHFWTAKAGGGGTDESFILFWYTADAGGGLGDALPVTMGTWSTPLNDQGVPRALSHLTFYDEGGGGPPSEIPEPGSLLLIGGALAALGLRRRIFRT